MEEQDLIKKIKKLKEIRPRKDWVLLTKNQILGTTTEFKLAEKPKFELFPFLRPVYAGLFFFFLLIGLFGFSRNALPGEPLYLFKKIVEKAQLAFVSENKKPEFNLQLANKRLEELNQIAQKNEVKKLAPAINEFQSNASQAAKNLAKVKVDKEIVAQTRKLADNKEKVERTLGTVIENKEYNNALAQLVENQIKELEGMMLSEEQKEILALAKKDFEAEDYSEALIKIFINLNK